MGTDRAWRREAARGGEGRRGAARGGEGRPQSVEVPDMVCVFIGLKTKEHGEVFRKCGGGGGGP